MLSIAKQVLAQARGQQQTRMVCPECSPHRLRHHQHDRTLSVTATDDGYWYYCHHCGAKGLAKFSEPNSTYNRYEPPIATMQETLSLTSEAIHWLAGRGIGALTANRLGIESVEMYSRQFDRNVQGVAFPYRNGNATYAWKLRSIESKEFLCNGRPQSFWNIDAQLGGGKSLIVTEGEIDAVSFAQIGSHAVSVPHGAWTPALAHRQQDDGENGKLRFLWSAREILQKAEKVLIATDADEPGVTLGEELARRIGKGKCLKVTFPDGVKDANECLTKLGPDALKACLDNAIPYPVAGLHTVSEFTGHVDSLYETGLKGGESTGWGKADTIMSIAPGMLYVVTGIPASGKSSWLDALAVNLAKQMDWNIAFASFENPVPIHIAKLASLYMGLPFGDRYDPRMTKADLRLAMNWIEDHFMFMSNEGDLPTVSSILDRARVAVLRRGARMVVVDPANFIQTKTRQERERGTDNEAVDSMLAEMKNFAMVNDVAFFLCAHPRKPPMESQNWSPGGYSISGTAGFYNRTDVGITVHRQDPATKITVWKSRFSHIASHGDTELYFDVATGRFGEHCPAPTQEKNQDEDPFEL